MTNRPTMRAEVEHQQMSLTLRLHDFDTLPAGDGTRSFRPEQVQVLYNDDHDERLVIYASARTSYSDPSGIGGVRFYTLTRRFSSAPEHDSSGTSEPLTDLPLSLRAVIAAHVPRSERLLSGARETVTP